MTIKIKKVILSRKGFDSGEKAGGDYSRVDPVTGKYIVLPIPENGNPNPDEFYKYEELCIKPDHFPGIDISNLKDLIINTGMNKSALRSPGFAHFDPWLGPCPWMEKNDLRNPAISAFGQQDKALAHLKNQGVKKETIQEGCLFLFYSRFKPLKTSEIGNLKIDIDSRGAYFIYGWLKVGKIIDSLEGLDPVIDRALKEGRHPHYGNIKKGQNEIFLGAEFLDEEETLPGFGYFLKLNPKLMLSKPEDKTKTQPGGKPTIWELPGFFYRDNEHKNERLTYLKDKAWEDKNGKATMSELKGYGQEYVFDTSKDTERFNYWLYDDLISLMPKK